MKFLFLALLLCMTGFAEEKIYVPPGSVYVAPTGIFLNINDEMVKVDQLFTDSQGVYVIADGMNPECVKWRYWQCPFCEQKNTITDKVCINPKCPSRQK